MPHVTTEIADAVATVTLDHERRRNALSHALVEEVIAALQRFREAKARVVILRARPGAKVFSAGHDIDELPEAPPRPARLGRSPAPAGARDRGLPWAGDRDGRGQRLGRGHRDRARLRPDRRRRERHLRGHPGQARRALQCRRHAHLPQRRRPAAGQGDDLHRPAFGRDPCRAAGPDQPGRAGSGAGGGHAGPGTGDRGQRAVERGGDEGAAADPGRRPPDDSAGVRAGTGAAPGGLRQRRLPGGNPCLQGEAPARVHGASGAAPPGRPRAGGPGGSRPCGSGAGVAGGCQVLDDAAGGGRKTGAWDGTQLQVPPAVESPRRRAMLRLSRGRREWN